MSNYKGFGKNSYYQTSYKPPYQQYQQYQQHQPYQQYQQYQSLYQPDYSSDNEKSKKDSFIGDEIDEYKKTELLDYLYSNVELYQIKYTILKTVENAQVLKTQPFHITPHFHGYNYYLIIKKLNNDYIGMYAIYKMDLKFNRHDVIDNNVKMYKICSSYPLNKYNNTIIDGKLIFKKDQKLFLINDVLYYKGEKLLTHKLEDKFIQIDYDIEELNNNINGQFELKIIKLYTYSELHDLVYNRIKISDFKINGIIFYPHRTGKHYIYINDQEFETIKKSPNIDTNVIPNVINVKLPSNLSDTTTNKTLLLQKTQIVDVYEVFSLEKDYRFGIASVPDIATSHKLRKYFETNNQMITECIYDNKFSKWKPILNV
jgi:hypothetical protein